MTSPSMKQMTLYLTVCVLAVFAASAVNSAETFRLEDDKLCAEFDALGRIIRLENKTTGKGNVIAEPVEETFNMVCKKGQNWEAVVFPKEQNYRVSKEGNTIRTVIDKVSVDGNPSELTLTMSAALKGGTLVYSAEIDNREKELTVVEFRYPKVGVIRSLGSGKKFDLLWPHATGKRFRNFSSTVSGTYPGDLSMQWTALTDDSETLYFSGRDTKMYTTTFHAGYGNGAALTSTRFVFVKTGEKCVVPETIAQLYSGSWRRAADEYRNWASAWRKVRSKPDWVHNMFGYFLVINKQQYGDEMWQYDTLPKLYELAKNHGFDTLGLFGWYEGGHDNTYPDIEVGKTLGGADKLRENIKKVRDAGGNVTLYVQGHLIDPTTDFYSRHGREVEAHSHWGSPYYEHYNKSSRSEFLPRFTAKVFSTACPGHPIWQERMVRNVDFIHDFGASGVLFDQIGGMPPRPCFNKQHNHANPGLSHVAGRVSLLDKIHRRTREVGGDFAFLTEHITDVYSQYADMLHGVGVQPDERDFSEMFRYCFPDTIITVRNPAPDISSMFSNFAITYGLVMEMEIRYRSDCEHVLADKSKERREHAQKVAALRNRYRDILGHGKFVDEEPLRNSNSAVKCKAFETDNRLAVVLWNPAPQTQDVKLDVPGRKLLEVSTLAGGPAQSKLPVSIGTQQVIVAVYEK
ncbi:MAG: DUF6259 domain-containing protein [Planctomycetaceae bacterium]|nr:DUF6259 domain-containing protein [Planctomycetaceae bacterium]